MVNHGDGHRTEINESLEAVIFCTNELKGRVEVNVRETLGKSRENMERSDENNSQKQ